MRVATLTGFERQKGAKVLRGSLILHHQKIDGCEAVSLDEESTLAS